MSETETILVMLTVPRGWAKLPVPEIARKLRGNEPQLSEALAHEVKRWAGSGTVNLTELQKFIDQRTGGVES